MIRGYTPMTTKNEADATCGENVVDTDGALFGSALPIPASTVGEREMPCPVCGAPMPDLKGGKAAICSVCGFKDSCCF
jgi:hypothetical protein